MLQHHDNLVQMGLTLSDARLNIILMSSLPESYRLTLQTITATERTSRLAGGKTSGMKHNDLISFILEEAQHRVINDEHTQSADEHPGALLLLTDYFADYSIPFPPTLSRRCVQLYTHEEHIRTLLPTDQKPIQSRKDQYQCLLDSTPPTYNNRLCSHSYYFNSLYHRILLDYPIPTHFESRISDQNFQRYATSPFSNLKSSYFTSSWRSQEQYLLDNRSCGDLVLLYIPIKTNLVAFQ